MKRYLYIACLFLPLFVSCEKEIGYIGDQAEPVLVLEALPHAGSKKLVCYVSRSRFFLDSTRPDSASMAKVSIGLRTSSGACTVVRDSIAGLHHVLFLSDALPAGATLYLAVSHPDYPTIEAAEYIVPPCMPAVESLQRDTSGYHLSLRLPDYPYKDGRIGINGVLYATMTWDDTIQRPYTMLIIRSKDEIFAPLNSFYLLYESYLAFAEKNERLFFQSDYPADTQMHVWFTCPTDWGRKTYRLDSIVLSLEARSTTYSTYLASLRKYMNQNSDGSGMTIEEPVTVYTNVTNGYGVLASTANSKIIIK